MNNDGTIVVATGASRWETAWKNHKITWSQLVNKLKDTHRTLETVAEYRKLAVSKQDQIKDIGGFVGGFIDGGHRLAGSIKYRTLLTLDLDYADTDFWQDFTLQYQVAAALYSTHKHTPDSPRYRLVLPLDRAVSAEEYEAIGRRLAGNLGMALFDPTTFQPSRLMYWPSTSKDGQYVFETRDRIWLSADEVLGEYADWKDSSTWPVHPAQEKIRSRSQAKQGEPIEKPGLIGAFCSVHGIVGAIEKYLSDVYLPCDHMPGRYTFTGGSTSGGLVIYDDKYAYSHHSTDPAGNRLCNAFDLVRLHLHGAKDLDAEPDTPINRLPSNGAMLDLAGADPGVKQFLGAQRLTKAREVFDIEPIEEGADGGQSRAQEGSTPNNDWMEQLSTDRKGKPLETIDNILVILRHDPAMKGRLAYDEFTRQHIVKKSLPWRKIERVRDWWNNTDEAGLRHYLESVYEITAIQKIRDGLDLIMYENRFHPVKDYLGRVAWDGQSRLDELLIDYMGAEDSAYTRAATRKCLTAAVARIYEPGIKYDYVLTLVGDQGQGKSTLFRELAGVWFSDSFSGVQNKEAFEQLQGVWIMEIAELAGIRKAEVEAIKHYITKQIDSYRPAYGRVVEHYPRQSILIATTNAKQGFLRDDTGDRRFWPITTMVQEPSYNVFDDLSGAEIDQIWAEAVHRYKAGEPLYLKELEPEAKKVQEAHKVYDERVAIIAAYLEMPLPETWPHMNILERQLYLKDEEQYKTGTILRKKVCVAEIWCELFGGNFKDMNSNNTKGVHSMLTQVRGWSAYNSTLVFPIYGKHRAYVRVVKN